MKPTFVKVVAGWAAVADRWAVFGNTEEEAAAKFVEAERRREEIEARDATQ